jgi:hypothetical protein
MKPHSIRVSVVKRLRLHVYVVKEFAMIAKFKRTCLRLSKVAAYVWVIVMVVFFLKKLIVYDKRSSCAEYKRENTGAILHDQTGDAISTAVQKVHQLIQAKRLSTKPTSYLYQTGLYLLCRNTHTYN